MNKQIIDIDDQNTDQCKKMIADAFHRIVDIGGMVSDVHFSCFRGEPGQYENSIIVSKPCSAASMTSILFEMESMGLGLEDIEVISRGFFNGKPYYMMWVTLTRGEHSRQITPDALDYIDEQKEFFVD